MMTAYKQVHCKSNPETPQGEEYIDYKGRRLSFKVLKHQLLIILFHVPPVRSINISLTV